MKIPGWAGLHKLFIKYVPRRYLLLSLGILCPFLKASSQVYFQQEVNFKINVTLNDRKHELDGFESVEYINNSPDTLGFLYFHLWPNAYSGNQTALARQIFSIKGKQKLFNDPELRGYIDSLDFDVEGTPAQWDLLSGTPDICKIILNEPLKKGDTIIITTPFHVKIPSGVTSLFGHLGESYQISQWYPKPAVYDRSGWHQMPYLDQGEFYSEYGSYDVSITLPANYVVGATGDLQNEQELRKLDILAADTLWKNIPDNADVYFPPSSTQMKTLRYTQNKIHDFAWFADKRFHVMKGKVRLPDSGREITTWAMFTYQEATLWKQAISYLNNSIWYFSKWNGDYPYDSFTAVQSVLSGGAGMEYPGLTVISLADDAYKLEDVMAHEVGHSWYYSALGSDERSFPYMDEGIVSAYEARYMEERYPHKKLWETYFKNKKLAKVFHNEEMPVQRIEELDWLIQARNNMEQPINLPAPDYSPTNYNIIIYNKAAHGFNYLRAYLGDPLFDTIMHDYYRIWKFRHPGPDDLRAIFESHTDKDLSWFFDDFLGTTRRLDYKIVRYENRKLLIKNNGELKAPLLIAGMTGNLISSEKWEEGFTGEKWISLPPDDYSGIKIDPQHKMPELYRLNNNIRTSGIFRKADPLKIQFLYTLEDPDKRALIYIPAFNWNSSDGFMAGFAINNGTLIPKPVNYVVFPFYTFRYPGVVGYGRISFNIAPYDNIIRMATFTIEGEQFGAIGNQDFKKVKLGLDLHFRSAKMINPVNHQIFGYYIGASDLLQIENFVKAKMQSFWQFGYQLEKTGMINPFKISVSFESGKSFQKTSLELNYKYSYIGKNSGLEMRLFAGAMLKEDNADPFFALSPSGRSGREQYLYDGTYPDLFGKFPKTFFSRQMTLSEGGLVTPVSDSLGYSNWVCSLSFTAGLPGKASWVPVKGFVNLLLNDHGRGTINKPQLFFEAGLKAGLWNFFEIYFPLLVSDNINPMAGSVKERFRFIFNIDMLGSIRLKSTF